MASAPNLQASPVNSLSKQAFQRKHLAHAFRSRYGEGSRGQARLAHQPTRIPASPRRRYKKHMSSADLSLRVASSSRTSDAFVFNIDHPEDRSPWWESGKPADDERSNGDSPPAQVEASDSDHDQVISDLIVQLPAQATGADSIERIQQALAARTWGELRELLADLPAARPGPRAPTAGSPRTRPSPSSRRFRAASRHASGHRIRSRGPRRLANMAGSGLAGLVQALLIAQRLVCTGAPGRSG